MGYVVFVLFMIDGTAQEVDGWGPRRAPTVETCIERRDRIAEYIKQTQPGASFVVACAKVKGELA